MRAFPLSEAHSVGGVLAEQLDRLFAREVDRETLVAIESGHFPIDLWAQVVDLGANLALTPEAEGGAALSWHDSEALLRTLGRHAAPVPLGETLVACALSASAGIEIPTGNLAVLAEPLELDAGDRLDGHDPLVAWAPSASYFVAEAHRAGERMLVMVQGTEVQLNPVSTYGRIPTASVRLTAARPSAIGSLHGTDAVQSALAIVRSAQIAGALETVLAQCIDYANTRHQFGKSIGKFQAIQQHLAELALATASAQVATLYGCRSLDNSEGRRGAAVAKIRSGAAAGIAGRLAHQIFGAIGITDEHLLHFYTRRLWQWRGEAGSERAWAEQLGNEVLKAGGAALWSSLVR
jgi:acyl-CoA dehydrogenase